MSKIMPVQEAGGSHMIDPGPIPNGDQGNLDDLGNIMGPEGVAALSPEDLALVAETLKALQQRKADVFSGLASDVEAKLNNRMGTRKSKENQWLEALRIYLGSLSSYNIVTGDYPFGTRNDANIVHRPEFNIIRQKCNLAISQTISHQFAAGDKNWNIRPPQVIDLDPHDIALMIQESGNPDISPEDAADLKCQLMEREIEYHLDLTNYALEARKAAADRAILGMGVLKGPLNAGKLKRIYRKQQTSDGHLIRVQDYSVETTPLVYRVNPWYFFPDDSVTDIECAEDSIEVHPMNKMDLKDLIKHPGYFPEEIQLCLSEEPRTYTNSPFNDPAYLTQGINLLKNKYLVLEYHGPIKKSDLDILDIKADMPDGMDEVFGEIWVCNSRVIRLQLSTLEGCNHVPYQVCVWEPDPACIPGFGIPMLARDQQRVVNETYKMILDNAGISAGPQVIVDTTVIKPADGGMVCEPWKVWYSQEYGADISKAIMFFTPTNSFDQLSSLLTLARGFADEESSINLYTGNSGTAAGAMDNATGMALINENAMTPLFYKSEEWDDNITRPLIAAMYDWEMQYNPKEEIKGTFSVDVRTTTAYLKGIVEQQSLDRLAQEITQGSPVGEYVNMDALMEARLSCMKLPYNGIVKSQQQLAQERQHKAQQPPQPDPNMLKAQAAQQQVQVDQQRLSLEQNRLQFEQQKHDSDTQLQGMTIQSTVQAKNQQHELDLTKAQVEAQAKQQQAQSQVEVAHLQMQTQLAGQNMQIDSQKQQAGLKHVQHFQDLQVKQQQIASQERQAQQKTEIQLRTARVNAEARTKNIPNRNLSEHNPKPK